MLKWNIFPKILRTIKRSSGKTGVSFYGIFALLWFSSCNSVMPFFPGHFPRLKLWTLTLSEASKAYFFMNLFVNYTLSRRSYLNAFLTVNRFGSNEIWVSVKACRLGFYLPLITCTFIHPPLHLLSSTLILSGVIECLSPVVNGREAGYTPDRLPIHPMAHLYLSTAFCLLVFIYMCKFVIRSEKCKCDRHTFVCHTRKSIGNQERRKHLFKPLWFLHSNFYPLDGNMH